MKKILLAFGLVAAAFSAKSQIMWVQNHTSCQLAFWGYADYGGGCGNPTALITSTIVLAPSMVSAFPVTSGFISPAPSAGWGWIAAKTRDSKMIPTAQCAYIYPTNWEREDAYGGDPNCSQYQQDPRETPIIVSACNTCPTYTGFRLTYTPLPGGDVQVDIN